jgi:hypothetical protein
MVNVAVKAPLLLDVPGYTQKIDVNGSERNAAMFAQPSSKALDVYVARYPDGTAAPVDVTHAAPGQAALFDPYEAQAIAAGLKDKPKETLQRLLAASWNNKDAGGKLVPIAYAQSIPLKSDGVDYATVNVNVSLLRGKLRSEVDVVLNDQIVDKFLADYLAGQPRDPDKHTNFKLIATGQLTLAGGVDNIKVVLGGFDSPYFGVDKLDGLKRLLSQVASEETGADAPDARTSMIQSLIQSFARSELGALVALGVDAMQQSDVYKLTLAKDVKSQPDAQPAGDPQAPKPPSARDQATAELQIGNNSAKINVFNILGVRSGAHSDPVVDADVQIDRVLRGPDGQEKEESIDFSKVDVHNRGYLHLAIDDSNKATLSSSTGLRGPRTQLDDYSDNAQMLMMLLGSAFQSASELAPSP